MYHERLFIGVEDEHNPTPAPEKWRAHSSAFEQVANMHGGSRHLEATSA